MADFTSLPNLHPALVHFPIALLPVALLFDLVGLINRSQRVWLDRAATSLYALAGLSTAVAFWVGRHFRGLQNGEVVVHGHRPPLAEGGWGLVLDGRGVVRIRSMKIISIVE